MQRFTTNWLLRDSFDSTKKGKAIDEEELLSKEIKKKIKLIKKAFR